MFVCVGGGGGGGRKLGSSVCVCIHKCVNEMEVCLLLIEEITFESKKLSFISTSTNILPAMNLRDVRLPNCNWKPTGEETTFRRTCEG